MSVRKASLIGLAIATLAFCVPVTWQIYKYDCPNPSPLVPVAGDCVLGPEVAEVGELVRLKACGDDVEWTCLPESADTQKYGENDQNFVISFRKKGAYTVIAAIVQGGDLRMAKQTINVGRVVNNDVDDPVIPDEDEVIVDNDDFDVGIAQMATEWCVSAQCNKGTASKLSSNFKGIAARIDDGELTTTNKIIMATAEVNNEVNLDGFETVMAEVQALLNAKANSGKLSTPQAHAAMWRSIAEGFAAYASH